MCTFFFRRCQHLSLPPVFSIIRSYLSCLPLESLDSSQENRKFRVGMVTIVCLASFGSNEFVEVLLMLFSSLLRHVSLSRSQYIYRDVA